MSPPRSQQVQGLDKFQNLKASFPYFFSMGNTIIQGVLVRMKAHASLQCAWPLGKGSENKWCQVHIAVWDQPWSVYSLTLKDKMGRVGLAQDSSEESGEASRRQ